VAVLISQVVGGFVAGAVMGVAHDGSPAASALIANGTFLSLVICASAPLSLALIVKFVKLRGGASLRDYLALRGVPSRDVLAWLGAMSVVLALTFAATLVVDPSGLEFAANAYRDGGVACAVLDRDRRARADLGRGAVPRVPVSRGASVTLGCDGHGRRHRRRFRDDPRRPVSCVAARAVVRVRAAPRRGT
jgi:hypothetical protein